MYFAVTNYSDSISPYGRLVEVIDQQPKLDRDNFLTKCLFLGNLDLTFSDGCKLFNKN